MTSKPRTIGDFTVLPVAYSGTTTHFLYVRKNATADGKNQLPDDRTLFIVNLPPDATEGELKQFFSTCGDVQRVVFGKQSSPENLENDDEEQEKGDDQMDEDKLSEDSDSEDSDSSKTTKNKKKGGKKKDAESPAVPKVIPLPTVPLRTLRPTGHSAHIIFHGPSSLNSALALPSSSSSPLPWPKSKLPSGLSHYLTRHHSLRPTLTAIRQHADSSLLLHEHNLTSQKALKGHNLDSKYKKGEAIVDDDGFTLVTRGGVYGQTVGGGVGVASKKFMKEQKEALRSGKRGKKKKEKRKEGFYDFQSREKKLQAQIQMKKKWEEDLAKVAKLRASRNFKPY